MSSTPLATKSIYYLNPTTYYIDHTNYNLCVFFKPLMGHICGIHSLKVTKTVELRLRNVWEGLINTAR